MSSAEAIPDDRLIELAELAATARGETPVLRSYIEDALKRIRAGYEEVLLYPSGAPSLEGMYQVARRLEQEASQGAA